MMKRWLVFAGIIVLAAALVFFNQGLKKSAAPDEDEQAPQTQTQKPAPAPATVDPNSVLPPEETAGNPATAKHHIEVGWVYDEGSQLKPETLNDSIQAVRDFVRQSAGVASAEIVDLDVPREDRSPAARTVTNLGIKMDGQSLYSGNLSEMPGGAKIVYGALTGAINNDHTKK